MTGMPAGTRPSGAPRPSPPASQPIRGVPVRRYEPDKSVQVHSRAQCTPPCAIHAPSPHHMVTWPAHMRRDPMKFPLIERHCPEHGVGHPDPDSLAHLAATTGDNSWAVHGCCGCCTTRTGPGSSSSPAPDPTVGVPGTGGGRSTDRTDQDRTLPPRTPED